MNGYVLFLDEVKKREEAKGQKFTGGLGNQSLKDLADSEWNNKSRGEKRDYKDRARDIKKTDVYKLQKQETCGRQKQFRRPKCATKADSDDEVPDDFYNDYTPKNKFEIDDGNKSGDVSDDDNSKCVPNVSSSPPHLNSTASVFDENEINNYLIPNVPIQLANLNLNPITSLGMVRETTNAAMSNNVPQLGQHGQRLSGEIVRPGTKSLCAKVLEHKRNSRY